MKKSQNIGTKSAFMPYIYIEREREREFSLIIVILF